jgi:hypothetical protein
LACWWEYAVWVCGQSVSEIRRLAPVAPDVLALEVRATAHGMSRNHW